MQEPREADAAVRRPSIWELAWPSITTNLLFSIIGVVSIKVVAELGPSAAAAVTVGNQIFFTLQAVMMAVSAGTTALVARPGVRRTRTRRCA